MQCGSSRQHNARAVSAAAAARTERRGRHKIGQRQHLLDKLQHREEELLRKEVPQEDGADGRPDRVERLAPQHVEQANGVDRQADQQQAVRERHGPSTASQPR